MGKLQRNEKTRASYYRNPYCKKELQHFALFPKEYNREELIEYIINTNLVEWYTCKLFKKTVDNYYVQEYIQEIWVQILQLTDDKLRQLWQQGYPAVTAFISTIIRQNVISVNSPAYMHIRNHNDKLIHVDTDVWDEMVDWDEKPDIVKEIIQLDEMKNNNKWLEYE